MLPWMTIRPALIVSPTASCALPLHGDVRAVEIRAECVAGDAVDLNALAGHARGDEPLAETARSRGISPRHCGSSRSGSEKESRACFYIILLVSHLSPIFHNHSPAWATPRISSSFSVRPMPRSISAVAAQRLDGVDAHAAHHLLDLVLPCGDEIHEPLRAHVRDPAACTSSGLCVAMPQLHRPVWQVRQRWQPSASSAAVPM